MSFLSSTQIIEEELEEGELADSNDERTPKKVVTPRPNNSSDEVSRKKEIREDLEDGEIVSSDEDEEVDENPPPRAPPAANTANRKSMGPSTGPNMNAVKKAEKSKILDVSKEKRSVENKENRADKKKGMINLELIQVKCTIKGICRNLGSKPRWTPLNIEPPSVRPKSQRVKGNRSPKDGMNGTQEPKKTGKG